MKITIETSADLLKLVCEDAAVLEKIRLEFSVENKAKKFARNKQFIASRLYAITPTGLFDAGLTREIAKIVAAKQLASSIKYTPESIQVFHPCKLKSSFYNDLSLPLRDYQEHAVEQCLEFGRGICQLATGAGKTLIMASLAASYFKDATYKCLILVPDPGLALQTYNDFVEYKVPFKCGVWTGQSKLDESAHVIIANHDIVLSRFKEHEWIEYVDVLIADEVHSIKKSNQINKIVSKIKTPHKFGFTGTLPSDAIDKWNVIGKFGSILTEKASHELREQNFLANVEAKVLRIKYVNQVNKPTVTKDSKGNKLSTAEYRAELEFIYHNKYRNNIIQQLCAGFNNNILILVNHLQHGDALYQKLNNALVSKSVQYIKGEVDLQEREEVKKQMEQDNNMVVIAMSSIFSTGINIKNIHMIIFAAGGKSSIRVVQSIGRGLRKNENKQKLSLIDVQDMLRYGADHGNERLKIYNKEKIKYTFIDFVEKL